MRPVAEHGAAVARRRPRVVLFGTTALSRDVLRFVCGRGLVELVGIVTAPEVFKISYAQQGVRNYNFAALRDDATPGAWVHTFDKDDGRASEALRDRIAGADADVLLVAGWYYMLPRGLRGLARFGAWGVHASLLPRYAGGAPLVWAMLERERETGVTLFQLGDGVDDGDILGQRAFALTDADYIADVLARATEATCAVLDEVLRRFPDVQGRPQRPPPSKIWPQRSPGDGELLPSMTSELALAFVRAQSRPYPGAFLRSGSDVQVFWRARVADGPDPTGLPGLRCADGRWLIATDFERR